MMRLKWLLRRGLRKIPIIVPWLNDMLSMRRLYVATFGTAPKLLSPTTFNEKIHYRKLLDRRPIYNVICDKLAAKDYVAERVEDAAIPQTLRIYDAPGQFEAEHVTRKCVLKSNAGWGHVLMLEPGAIDADEIEHRIDEMLRQNHGVWTREWGYYGITPRAFLEEFIDPGTGCRVPVDYKFYCFGGRVEMVSIVVDRFTGEAGKIAVDRSGGRLDLRYVKPSVATEMPVSPRELARMVEVAERVSSGWDFLRVDLYYSAGTIYVGELTPYPAAGLGRFEPETWDTYFGKLWHEHRSLKTWTNSILAETWGL